MPGVGAREQFRGSFAACSTQGCGVDLSLRVRGQFVDLGEIGLIDHERLARRGNSIDQPQRHASRQQVALPVEDKAHNVRLGAVVEDLPFAGGVNSQDLALVAGPHIQSALLVKGQGPDVLGVGVIEYLDFPSSVTR